MYQEYTQCLSWVSVILAIVSTTPFEKAYKLTGFGLLFAFCGMWAGWVRDLRYCFGFGDWKAVSRKS